MIFLQVTWNKTRISSKNTHGRTSPSSIQNDGSRTFQKLIPNALVPVTMQSGRLTAQVINNSSNTSVNYQNQQIRPLAHIPSYQTNRKPLPQVATPNLQPQQSGMIQTHQATIHRSITNINRKKRRSSDKIISPEIRKMVPEAEAYMGLLSFEQKLDSTLARKRLEIQESLKRPIKIKRKLRIFVSHTFTPGKEPEREGDEGTVPMWELRVEGRVLDDIAPSSSSGTTSATKLTLPKRKFSSFFKKLVIELDEDIYGPDNHLVEWNRTPQTNETDGFQVKRPGDKDVKCTILLLLNHQPMKFKLHPKLSKLLGIALETRSKIIESLWHYIKAQKLQDATDRDVINCDSFLEQIFNSKKMRFKEIPQRIGPLLQEPDPLVLHHIIKHEPAGKNHVWYDIEIELDDPSRSYASTFLQNYTNMPDISAIDQKIHEIIEQLDEWKIRRDFYSQFSEDPQGFIQRWLISQSRDLKNISEISQDFELERRTDYYNQSQVEEGVFRYIYGKVLQKRFELEATLGVKNN